MSPPEVLVVGESLVDVVERPDGVVERLPGGSAANVAVALARLGRTVGLLTCLARDDAGAMLADHLARSGVDLVGDPWVLDRTSTATARTAGDGSASYQFDLAWDPAPVDVSGYRAVHVGSIGAVLLPGADLVRDLVRRSRGAALVSYDVNARTTITGAGPEVVARTEQLASLADIVKVSDEDLAVLWPDREADDVVRSLLRAGAGGVAVTKGAEGTQWWDAISSWGVPASPVEVVDTIGAGDTFAAVLLHGVLELGRPWQGVGLVPVLEQAVLAAGISVARAGADPPWAEELTRAVASAGRDR